MSSPVFHGESQGHSESWSVEVAIIVPVDVVGVKKKEAVPPLLNTQRRERRGNWQLCVYVPVDNKANQNCNDGIVCILWNIWAYFSCMQMVFTCDCEELLSAPTWDKISFGVARMFAETWVIEALLRPHPGNLVFRCPHCSAARRSPIALQDTNGWSLNLHHFRISCCGLSLPVPRGQTISVTQ